MRVRKSLLSLSFQSSSRRGRGTWPLSVFPRAVTRMCRRFTCAPAGRQRTSRADTA